MQGTVRGQWPRLEEIVASPRLPTLPTVAVRIIELMQQPDVSIDDLSAVISNDPALTAKFLQTANSSFYARPRHATRVRDAIMVLGLRAAKPLALGFSLVAQMRNHNAGEFDYNEFWTRSLYTAALSRTIASSRRVAEPDEAFLAGLLHGLGIVALARVIGPFYDALLRESGDSRDRQAELERKYFGYDHTSVGFALAESWCLPPAATAAVRWYLDPAGASSDLQPLVRCVAAGSAGARVFVGANSGAGLADFRSVCEDWFQSSPEDVELFLSRAHSEVVAMGGLLDLPKLDAASIGEILANANEALERLTVAAIREAAALERRNVDLSAEASTDALTGVATRRYLDAFLDEAMQAAQRRNESLGLLFLDLDHFKQLNDTHGHQVGDVALQAVAAAIKRVVRESDFVGRFGGEEFVIVCPGANLIGATGLARRIREAIAATPIDDGNGGSLTVTASIGVAACTPQSSPSASALVSLADRGCYAAKAAGRNTVRIGQDVRPELAAS